MIGLSRILQTLVAALGLAVATQASAYNQMVVFGDSLSDVGNVYATSGGTVPVSPPYYNGHFSNGPIWVESLANSLGLSITPMALGGTDFAFGGARTAASGSVPSLTQQLNTYYLPSVGGVANPNALYVVFGGGNDVLAGSVTGSAGNISSIVSTLAAAGAVNFLVPNLPNVGLTPQAQAGGPAVVAGATALSNLFNSQLATAMASLRTANPSLNISSLDVYGFLNGIIASPGSYGLTNVTNSCYTGTTVIPGPICATPNQYLFWDGIHPTTVVHSALATTAIGVVPVPPAILLLGSALGALGWVRRKAA